MQQHAGDRRKAGDLRRGGTLNPRPEKVRSDLFSGGFFDPHDMMQVKYEMLRAVEHDGCSIAEAAAEFGLSRPAFYRARRDFGSGGLAGLLPRKRGPKAPNKLSAEMLAFIETEVKADRRVRAPQLRDRIEARFDTRVHTRTVRRAMTRSEKKGART